MCTLRFCVHMWAYCVKYDAHTEVVELVDSIRAHDSQQVRMRVPSRVYQHYAEVAELVDAHDSKSCSFGSGGSIPPLGTNRLEKTVPAYCFLDL